MKSDEEIMEILEAFDLTGSYRDTAELAGCSPHTVAHYVRARDEGRLSTAATRHAQLIDAYLGKLEEWVETSHAKVAPMSSTTSCVLLVMRAQSARRDASWLWRRRPIVPGTGGFIGPGCQSRACGSNSTGAMVRLSKAPRRGCSARGWPGAAFASCWP